MVVTVWSSVPQLSIRLLPQSLRSINVIYCRFSATVVSQKYYNVKTRSISLKTEEDTIFFPLQNLMHSKIAIDLSWAWTSSKELKRLIMKATYQMISAHKIWKDIIQASYLI